MTKLEEVARAIYAKRNGPGAKPWSIRPKAHKAPYLDDARAAIYAIREPNDAMLRSPSHDAAMWEHMVDAILSEGDGANP